jgi:hypothetical protein
MKTVTTALSLRISSISKHPSETLDLDDKAAAPFGYGETEPNFCELDFHRLVEMRCENQTEQAAKGIWVQGIGDKAAEGPTQVSMRRQLIRRFH